MVQKANVEIRRAAKEQGVPLWRVAEAMQVCDNTLYRMLRRELSKEQTEEIIRLIAEIAEGGE